MRRQRHNLIFDLVTRSFRSLWDHLKGSTCKAVTTVKSAEYTQMFPFVNILYFFLHLLNLTRLDFEWNWSLKISHPL